MKEVRRDYMKYNLKSLVEKIAGNEKSWKYNSNIEIKYSKDKNIEFINNYLQFSGKEILCSEFNSLAHNPEGENRLRHIVNAFFLGVALYEESKEIKFLVDHELEKYSYALDPFHKEAPFAYVWFLICIFHDCGYSYEKNLSKKQFHCFEELINKYGHLGRIEGVPALYDNVLKHYFRYRMDGNGRNVGKGVNDHGIVGAYKMYHHFCQIRAEKRKEAEGKDETNKWVKGLDDIYNLAAWIVACHNIFFANASDRCDICRFSYYHLYPLMKEDDDYKILLAEYPLFFFLHLIDNIEPTKVPGFEEEYLSLISIEVDDSKQAVTVSFPCEEGNPGMKNFVANYGNRLKDLKSWLTTTNSETKDGRTSISIYYKPQSK